jgi:hypothetical protein
VKYSTIAIGDIRGITAIATGVKRVINTKWKNPDVLFKFYF